MTDTRIATIADHYGFDHQCAKLTEEMAELIVAIHHLKNRNNSLDNAEFCEEFADVEILMDQIRHLLTPEFEAWVDECREYKLSRQMVRISDLR